MGKISLLSERTINQIAAGEVVERPLSIVKELVENSIDAGADMISVTITDGGKSEITVLDNGCGMSEDDLFMALERHATSKITSIDELTSISTMGFRGEAIPSIAAVTKFTISSATGHGQGFSISLVNGKIVSNKPVSMAKGTEITAGSLFHNIPARKKFLKSDDRESALIRELLQKFAITRPGTGFSLSHNGKNLFTYRKNETVEQRIASVWKTDSSGFSKAARAADSASIEVFVPDPFGQVPAISVVSVNGRIVSDRQINSAVLRSFRESIGGDFRSPVVIFLKTENGFTDINVHPSKLEVRFTNPQMIQGIISSTIANALKSFRKDHFSQLNGSETVFQPINSIKKEIAVNISNSTLFDLEKAGELSYVSENSSGYSFKFRDYKKIGIVFGVYQIIETPDRIIFLDLHASHERITFSTLSEKMTLNNGLSQILISPQIIKVSPSELSVFKENSALFSDCGFSIEVFDENSIIMRAVPALGFDTDWTGSVKEVIGQIINEGSSGLLNEKFMYFIASTACKASVKRNDPLSEDEIDHLISDINKSLVLTCPHGRPFFFEITRNEFEKKVHRR